jgi:hypothetical protein
MMVRLEMESMMALLEMMLIRRTLLDDSLEEVALNRQMPKATLALEGG